MEIYILCFTNAMYVKYTTSLINEYSGLHCDILQLSVEYLALYLTYCTYNREWCLLLRYY